MKTMRSPWAGAATVCGRAVCAAGGFWFGAWGVGAPLLRSGQLPASALAARVPILE